MGKKGFFLKKKLTLFSVFILITTLLILFIHSYQSKNNTSYTNNYSVCVAQTSEQRNSSVLTYYDDNLKQVNQQRIPYGGLGDAYRQGIKYNGKMYFAPAGLFSNDSRYCLRDSISLDLKTGKITEYRFGEMYWGQRNFTVGGDKMFANRNFNNISYLQSIDLSTGKKKEAIYRNVIFSNMTYAGHHVMLTASKMGTGHDSSKLLAINPSTLKTDWSVKLPFFMSPDNFFSDGNYLYFVQRRDEIEQCWLVKVNLQSHKYKLIPLDKKVPGVTSLHKWNNLLLLSSADLATGHGKYIVQYDPDSGHLRYYHFSHNVSLLKVKKDCVYILDNDLDRLHCWLYKYKIEKTGFKYVCKTDVYTMKKRKRPYYYVADFFLN